MVKQYSNAHKARSIQDVIGWPSTAEYIKYVEKGLIRKLPHHQGGHYLRGGHIRTQPGSLKGKTTRKTPERVTLNSLDNLPNELLTEYGNVTI